MRRLSLLLALVPALAAAQSPVAEALSPALTAACLDASLDLVAAEIGPEAAFSPEAARAEILVRLAATTTREGAEAFAAWTLRPDVAPMLARECETASPAFEDRLGDFWDAAEIDPDGEAWTLDFLDRTGYVDYAARMGFASMEALAVAIEAEEKGRPLTDKEGAEAVEKMRAEIYDDLLAQAEAELFDVYYVAFIDAPMDTLVAYAEAVEAPAAQWYFRAIPGVSSEVIGRAFQAAFAEE